MITAARRAGGAGVSGRGRRGMGGAGMSIWSPRSRSMTFPGASGAARGAASRISCWGRMLFAVAQDVHDGDGHGGDGGGVENPAWRVPGGVVVDEVAAWWSVCRGGFLADGGAGGGLVDDGLAGCVGGEQRGDGEPVDGPGQAAGLAVDGAAASLK